MSYINKLQEAGITTTRAEELSDAMKALHLAISKLDNQQLRTFSANNGLIGHLDMYAKENPDIRNVAVEMYNNNLHASVRNIDFDEFTDFSDKLFYLTEQAAEMKIPGAKMLCKSLMDIRKKFENTRLPLSRLAQQAENIAQCCGIFDVSSLEIRMTHKYKDAYRHLDENIRVGTVETLRHIERKKGSEDGKNLLIIRVTLDQDRDTLLDMETIRDTIYRHFTYSGCTHEYDCCGCISQTVTGIKLLRVNGFDDNYIFAVKTSWYRNF